MTIQFLDGRLSVNRNDSSGTDGITDTPLLIGDIGLQTGAAALLGNEGDVRVALTGTVGIVVDGVVAELTFTIERNGTSAPGSGVLILTEAFNTGGVNTIGPVSISAGDFPPAADVLAGEIRYTLFVSATITEGNIALSGPVVFNGTAFAGTTTS
ncbi:conserved hypothetical protein [Paenibacillus curdlanolyticus YK9]|uniref:Uncharacterized protein n=1 Tax=Paenibacillus curdlanolyticus YK9 TaxID=717606 RepID=E0I5Y7_9BACL|nr:hypothetical protein [Paenibacillus curdlanolyticus]EFM12379.1 conserved hypothetical protein [Paenibacillus curdlanolyticus YK9]